MTLSLRRLALLAAGITTLLTASLASSTGGISAESAEERASDFYRWEEPLTGEPGRILRSEPLAPELSIEGAAAERRILYSSTGGIDGEPTAVSGMLFLPEGPPPDGGWPLLAWAHGTTGLADACAPSRRGPGQAVGQYLQAWIEEGYAVVATDYEGLGTPGLHPYLAARPAAYSVLDSIRAALASGDAIADEVVIAGQSQGGGAAFASGAFAPEYAPELPIRGIIASGPPYLTADMPTASTMAPDQVDPGLAYVFYVGHVAVALDPGLDAGQLFREQALYVFQEAASACIGELIDAIRAAELSQGDTLREDAMERIVQTLLPHVVYPTMELEEPLFIATGTEDRDVDPRAQLMLVRDACGAGTLVRARLYAGEDHIGAWLASRPEAMSFAQAVRRGDTVEAECEPQPRPAP